MSKKSDKFLRFAGNRGNVSSVLVIRNGLVGDTIFVTPVLDRLRATFPEARIDMAAGEKSTVLLQGNPGINNVYPIPSRFSAKEHAKLFLSLRKYHYDIAVVQESNSHYTLMAGLVGARYTVGFENKLDWLLSYSVAWPSGVHAVFAELETVRTWTDSREPVTTSLAVAEEEIDEARRILLSNGITQIDRIVCIHPGCSGRESKREWVPEYYARLSDLLTRNNGAQVVLDGIPQDKMIIEKILSRVELKAVSILGQTSLRQFLGLMRLSRVLVGPDTGTLHLATAVGTPVVMLIGPTDPVDTGPYDPTGRSRVLRTELPCIGCFLRNPRPPEWEKCKDLYPVTCMQSLSPESVYQELIALLGW